MVDSKIQKIRKRDGRLVDFEINRITDAVYKALLAVGKDENAREIAEDLAKKILVLVEQRYRTPHVEEVQDCVEETLMNERLIDVAKAYIIYRDERKKIRDATKTLLDSQEIIRKYVGQKDWRVNENANIDYSHSGLLWHGVGTVMAYYGLNYIYPSEIGMAHTEGDFHIHNLSMPLAGYCAGWSLRQLLLEGFGGVPHKTESSPAKHFRVALGQMINFIGTLQNEWAGAQAFSSFDTYLAPFVRQDKLSYEDVKQCMQEYVYNMNVTSRWGGQCVSEDTEVLTQNGWKKHDELKDDKIATLNLDTKKVEFLKTDKISIYDYDGYLFRLKNRTQDQLVTPNHRVLRKKFNSSDFEFVEAENLIKFKTPVLVPISGETSNEAEISDDKIRLYAWLVSEGTFSEDRGRIALYQSQKNIENCNEIRNCFDNLDYSWHETSRIHGFSQVPSIRFRVNQTESADIRQEITSKEIPEIVKTLSKRQIRLFIDTYTKGDGHIEKNGRMRIYTKDAKIKDEIQGLCALCNYGSTINMAKNGVFIINIIRNNIASITDVSKVKYKGKVWCPTTKNGTFIARRKGKVFITGNSPFSNITLDLNPPRDLKDKPVIIGGKLQDQTYGDYQNEIDMINKAFLEVVLRGDARGRVFTWPIPTYNITKNFDWDSDVSNRLFEITSKYGIPNFSNFINSDLDPSDVRSMCCRLRLDLKELSRNVTGGLFGSGESTGSVGVVTINMPKIGYQAKEDYEFFERLDQLMYLAMRSLEIKRKVVGKNFDSWLLPYSKRYLGNLDHHFSTIGLIGMNEACLNFLGEDISSKQGKLFAVKVLNFMRDKIQEFQEETGHIYNLEATPGEGTSYRLAKKDKQVHPDMRTSGKQVPYYTNSTQLPVEYTDDILHSLRHQEQLQTLYTGGTIFHTFLGESLSPEESKMLIRKITSNFRLPYITLTPTFSVCQNHGYLKGKHQICPTCDARTEIYSRIVGYIRPVAAWNPGKQEEFKQRKTYNFNQFNAVPEAVVKRGY